VGELVENWLTGILETTNLRFLMSKDRSLKLIRPLYFECMRNIFVFPKTIHPCAKIFMGQGIIHMNYLVHYKIIPIIRKIISTKAEIIICMIRIFFPVSE
jgi:hypothetical protein